MPHFLRPSRFITFLLFLLLVMASNTQAKTIMWLADWYNTQIDSVGSIDSVYIPPYPKYGAITGFYFGTTPQMLKATNAYAQDMTVRAANTNGLPTTVPRYWYALPNWNSANFNGGEINIYMVAHTAWHQFNGAT